MSNQYTDTQYQWLCEAIRNHYNSDECLLWPFRKESGYGRLHYEGTMVLAHRLAYKVANGVWPEPKGLHTCNTPACFNPRHVIPGTQQENVAQRVAQGRNGPRETRGESNPRARFNDIDVIAIRRLCAAGISMGQLAAAFECKMSVISFIVHGKRWKHLFVFPDNERLGPASNHRTGEANGNSKLVEFDVTIIHVMLRAGIGRLTVADLFDVNRTTIGRIHRGQGWAKSTPQLRSNKTQLRGIVKVNN
jgi:hypothetical protein